MGTAYRTHTYAHNAARTCMHTHTHMHICTSTHTLLDTPSHPTFWRHTNPHAPVQALSLLEAAEQRLLREAARGHCTPRVGHAMCRSAEHELSVGVPVVQTHRTDRQTDRQTDTQTDRQTDKQTDRQTDRQTGRDRQTDSRQTDRQTHRHTRANAHGSTSVPLLNGREELCCSANAEMLSCPLN